MLPYTPLHHLLFAGEGPGENFPALVMTSANRKDEPICRTEKEVKTKLAGIADYFLVHNRPIHNRCDDSIVQSPSGEKNSEIVIRRSRGLVPRPVIFRRGLSRAALPCVFSAGAEQKNTFCLTRGNNAYLSQYIGDLDNAEAISFYSEAFQRHKRFLGVKPGIIAYDLHPDYVSTIFAKKLINSKPARSRFNTISRISLPCWLRRGLKDRRWVLRLTAPDTVRTRRSGEANAFFVGRKRVPAPRPL